MNRMDGMSMDLTAENIEQIKKLFPEAVTEGKIDFEVLKALLGGEIENRQEYYKFTWNGKGAARAYARTRSMGTLRPCEAESSGKDGTPGKFDSENLYIEGDNLEVLKLLQGAYHKRVKMIYIDPPYNTGKDFVYPDNFRDSIGNYKALTGQTNEEGKSTRANPETSGRYHTDWLNMMYPRLILARNLLTDDGMIFISIDDSEVSNLRKICDDVFGEENFVIDFLWKKKGTTSNVEGAEVSSLMDSTLCYKRTDAAHIVSRVKSKETRSYPFHDETGDYRTTVIEKKDSGDYKRDSMKFEILGHVPREGKRWQIGKEKASDYERLHRFIYDGEKILLKIYDFEDRDTTSAQPNLLEDCGTSDSAAQMVNIDLFNIPELFDNPKPVDLLKRFNYFTNTKNSIILDFFSGSATTAHAVMQLNAEDGGNRKFIMVQLPEACEAGTEAAKAGYKNICEIGKERIRRAAKKIKEELTTKDTKEHENKKDKETNSLSLFGEAENLSCNSCVSWLNQDFGFKVFKLDTSNVLPWNPNAETLNDDLFRAVDNVLADRSTQDLLYEILLKCNLPLTLPIDERKFDDNTVYVVGMGALAICLDKKIPQTIAEEIVKLRDEYAPIVPMQVVFRDNGFDDVSKTNALQILKQSAFEEKSIQTI